MLSLLYYHVMNRKLVILCVVYMKINGGKLTCVPVDDADHAVFTVVGAVDAQLVQQVQQQHAEVAVELADGGFKAGVGLEGVHVFG